MTFDPAFRFYSEDPQWRISPTIAEQYAEALEELAARKRTYPRRVETARMTQDQATHEIGVMQSIVDDLRPVATVARVTAEGAYGWTDQIHALRREIAMRRVMYPRWIADRGMDPDKAAHKLAVIEGMHASWWRWHWCPEAVAARAATEAMAA